MRGTHARRATVAALVFCGALLGGTACTGGTTDAPTPTTSTASDLAPITIEPEPLWRGSTGRKNEIPGIELRGESVLIHGNTDDELDRLLVVADGASGTTRWRLDMGGVLPGDDQARLTTIRQHNLPIVGSDDDWTAFVSYSADPEEYGVAALSGTNGDVQWRSPVHAERPLSGLSHETLAADSEIVVSAVSAGVTITDDPNQVRTFATNAATGERLWEVQGFWPQFVVGDTVLGQVGLPLQVPGDQDSNPGSAVVGLDARTGAKKWDIADRYPESKVYQVLGDVAFVSVPGDSRSGPRRTVVIDPGTGRQLADLGAAEHCYGDHDNLIMCVSSADEAITTFDVAKRDVSSAKIEGLGHIFGAWHGYLFLSDRVIDRFGKTVTSELPGTVIAMSDEYVILYDERSSEYATYRRISGP